VPPEPAPPAGYTAPADLLKDRVILVTGAGDGLGRATAIACAQRGATVVLLGRTVNKLESTYDAIVAAQGPRPAIYPMNLAGATWNDLAELAATLEREFGRLDGLVHCAAHFKNFTPLCDVDPRDWVEGLQVNLTAAYALTRLSLPLLAKSADASVVFVSDPAGRTPKPFRGGYGVAKAAIEALVQTWAPELRERVGLRLNTYDPGAMRTGLRKRGYTGEDIERVPPPEEAVPALLWLLGPDSHGRSGEAFSRS
jgi:NAD(P)-dependent dehydrogenase (short-subunit alcohol dehydrogenase family)